MAGAKETKITRIAINYPRIVKNSIYELIRDKFLIIRVLKKKKKYLWIIQVGNFAKKLRQ